MTFWKNSINSRIFVINYSNFIFIIINNTFGFTINKNNISNFNFICRNHKKEFFTNIKTKI